MNNWLDCASVENAPVFIKTKNGGGGLSLLSHLLYAPYEHNFCFWRIPLKRGSSAQELCLCAQYLGKKSKQEVLTSFFVKEDRLIACSWNSNPLPFCTPFSWHRTVGHKNCFRGLVHESYDSGHLYLNLRHANLLLNILVFMDAFYEQRDPCNPSW